MAELESLPPDQRAAVQLLVKQGRSYEELADLLAIDPSAVRRRAHDALEALGPQDGPQLGAAEQAEVSDYLLGQQKTSGQREAARETLERSPLARAWARSVASALRPLAPGAMPDIPDGGSRRDAERAFGDEAEGPAAYDTPPDEARPGSRLGGVLLLGGFAIVVAVVVILLLTRGGGNDTKGTSSVSSTPPTTSSQTTQGSAASPVASINLTPPSGGSRAVGLARVFRRGQQRAIILAAQGLSPGAYALWLYTSPGQSRFLGFVPQRVGKDGRFATQGLLPPDAGSFRQLIVTRETVTGNTARPPSRPGQIVLAGKLQLG